MKTGKILIFPAVTQQRKFNSWTLIFVPARSWINIVLLGHSAGADLLLDLPQNGCRKRRYIDRGKFVVNLGCLYGPHLLVSS